MLTQDSDAIPVYTITHAIRMLIIQKCETTLSWDQLRAPQVSQFLVKPIQTQIRADHFNRATLTALVANCLQFKKEAEINPGNAGVSRTRALLAELLAMRLLREYSTRELIDALSYDFDPLQGMEYPQEAKGKRVARPRSARISTVEIAIRATAKSFLAHPLVVQQLEAIWAGSIVFHSAADNLHRKPPKPHQARLLDQNQRNYGAIRDRSPLSPGTRPNGNVQQAPPQKLVEEFVRRSVTLYDPRDASLFKLSRLRVPRYRQLFSTLSFAIMLVLYLAVLVDHSRDITPLEVIFWIYSTGYMLDEIVGFTEQGFGLYILSVWNAFDLGILLSLVVYFGLRLYGVLIPDINKKYFADMAYDVLASTAVLLFPRAFSVLDHYRYFSQLLIAFRLMAQDMVAILVLIVISCSGFFVAFSMAFSTEDESASDIAYALFQIVMGFSPAAWSAWTRYNALGRTIMGFFLVICHFMIVTILITVLTNSFMAIVRNAEEEHQFLFAVNTISMVKSDALFSYIAPTNVLSWIISPTRYILPFRKFVKLNRTVIKITHFPILFSIFVYERLILSRIAYEPTDLVDRNQVDRGPKPVAFGGRTAAFNQRVRRLREPSVVSFRKEQALDEVFRRPFKGSETVRTTTHEMEPSQRKTSNVVDTWIQGVGKEGGASPPMEQPQSVLDRLENRRPGMRRAMTTDRMRTGRRDYSTATRSVISDPEDKSFLAARRPKRIEEETDPDLSLESVEQETDADDGDDELMTHDEADIVTAEQMSEAPEADRDSGDDEEVVDKENVPLSQSPINDYFTTPTAARPPESALTGAKPRQTNPNDPAIRTKRHHDRTVSTNTILFQPTESRTSSVSSVPRPPNRNSRPGTAKAGTTTPAEPTGYRTPRQPQPTQAAASRARAIAPPRNPQQAPNPRNNLAGFNFAQSNAAFGQRRAHREPSLNTLALDLASDFGDNRFGPSLVDVGGISGMPASFSEQMLREREAARRARDDERRRKETQESGVVQRLVLNRMNTLEEGFREVISAVRELREREVNVSAGSSSVDTRIDTRDARGSAPGAAAAAVAGHVGNLGAGSGATVPSAPRTPGGATKTKDKLGAGALKSPKKVKRPTPLSRNDTEITARRTSLPEDAATYSADNNGPAKRRSMAEPSYPGDATAGTERRDMAQEVTQQVAAPVQQPTVQTPTVQTSQEDEKGKETAGGKGKEKEDSSPNSVKSIVETLEQKGKLHANRQQERRSSSLGQVGRRVSGTGSAGGSSRSGEGASGGPSYAAVAKEGTEEGETQQGQTVGSRRPRPLSMGAEEEGKRESVIYVGKGPDLAAMAARRVGSASSAKTALEKSPVHGKGEEEKK